MSQQTNDQQLQIEIDRLRADFPRTQDLYREACVLLFFRYGITPTANKLYQFVRKGSMSAPSEALAKFWENLRQKSRVRIENPDLPEDLRVAAGELTAALWTKAQSAAQASLASLRSHALVEVRSAQSGQTVAEARAQELARELDEARQAGDRAGQRLRELYSKLEDERAARSALDQRMVMAREEQAKLHESLDAARGSFATDLDRIRAVAELAEKRLQTSEARAKVEIDRERSMSARLQMELEATRRLGTEAEDRNRSEMRSLQAELGQTRQQLGTLEGTLKELQVAKLNQSAELVFVRAETAQSSAALAVALRENELAVMRIKALEEEVSILQSRRSASVSAEGDKPLGGKAKKRVRRIAKKENPDPLLL
jgi:chromosome segregation ATPase